MSDDSIFEVQVRSLEKELAAARKTLRDQFAMAALTGCLASFGEMDDPSEYASSIAMDAYLLADAMMEVREK